MTNPSTPARALRLIGVPSDVHSSFVRGTAAGPAALRAALASGHMNLASECGVELHCDIALSDIGDLPLADTLAATAADDALIGRAVADAAAAGDVPLVIGGDHAVVVPGIAALARRYGPLSILHVDAHPDLYDDYEGDARSHASPFARVMEAGHAKRLVQVGIRTLEAHCRAQAERFGVEIIAMRDFTPAVVPVLDGPLYISIDFDGFDPAFAPGVAHCEPGGLGVRDVLARMTAPLVGADLVELHPGRDVNGMTATLGAKLVKEIAALAVRNGVAQPAPAH